MTWNDSLGDSFNSAHSSMSSVFNAAGVQVKGSCGSSFVTDVIKVERNGIENAVKIMSPSAAQDPDLVSRFLANARYNQALNDFTVMRILEIVENGPRPYYVIDRVAESSLLEVIRHHAPIDPLWLTNLLLPIARMLDTIHQRNVLHANIKPSNILIVVENGQEQFRLVDFLEPSLSSTSATITGAGVYAAPEFRAGMPVSNRSDIYSLAAIMYESFSGAVPNGAYRKADGTFHVWRNGDTTRELTQVNPEIERALSDVIMGGIASQAIARPASASLLVEDALRILEQPKVRVRPVEKHIEHVPVPMLLIGIGVFIATILFLFLGFKIASSIFGSDSPSVTTTTQVSSTNPNSDNELSRDELALQRQLPSNQQDCLAERTNDDEDKRWKLSEATLVCSVPDIELLTYGSFDNTQDLEDTYAQQEAFLTEEVTQQGGTIGATPGGSIPCATSPHEKGQWGKQDSTGAGGSYLCVSLPSPRMVWTEKNSKIVGYVEMPNRTVAELGDWWLKEAGPK